MNKSSHKIAVFLSLLLLTLFALDGKTTVLCAPYYEGKTIEIIAATAPGGGTDTSARAGAAFLRSTFLEPHHDRAQSARCRRRYSCELFFT